MRLTIRDATAYRYSEPTTYAIQTPRLTLRPYHGLNVIAWRVRAEGRARDPELHRWLWQHRSLPYGQPSA